MNLWHKLLAAVGLGRRGQADPVALDAEFSRRVRDLAVPEVVKRRLPRSAFTKRGPGVLANLRDSLLDMTVEQRLLAKNRGWDRGLVRDDGSVRTT